MSIVTAELNCHIVLLLIGGSRSCGSPLGVGEGPSALYRPLRSLMASRWAVSGAL